MKHFFNSALIVSALLTGSTVYAETAPSSTAQTPVYDAQTHAALQNIDARLAELSLKLSVPQVQGCSDGEHIYSAGFSIQKENASYLCQISDGHYEWKQFSRY